MVSKLFAPPGLLFLLAFGAYAYFYQAGGWNQNSRFDLVRAMAERGTVRIDAYEANTGDKALRDGHYYCDKAPGQSWLALPVYSLLLAPRAEEPDLEFLALSSYAVTVWTVALPSALGVAALWWLLQILRFRPATRSGICLAYALGTLAWPYSTLFHGHQLAAALLLLAFALLAAERRKPLPARRSLLLAGNLLGLAVAVEYQTALVVAVLTAYVLWWAPRRFWPWLVLPGAVWAVALLVYHWRAFGGPFTLPYEFSTQEHRHQGFFMGLGWPRPDAIWGLTFSNYRGLFFSAPWLLLALPGALRGWRRPERRPEWLVALLACGLYFWLSTSLVDWEGGWTVGPRYLVPVLPFLSVLAAGALPGAGDVAGGAGRPAMQKGIWAAFVLLAFWGGSLMLVATAVRPEMPDYMARPFHDGLLPAFFQERLAVSTQSIDALRPERGSTGRHAWNLGHQMGLEGFNSLAPLGVWLLVWGSWLMLRIRARSDL